MRLPQEGDQGPHDFRRMHAVGCYLARKHGVRIKANPPLRKKNLNNKSGKVKVKNILYFIYYF